MTLYHLSKVTQLANGKISSFYKSFSRKRWSLSPFLSPCALSRVPLLKDMAKIHTQRNAFALICLVLLSRFDFCYLFVMFLIHSLLWPSRFSIATITASMYSCIEAALLDFPQKILKLLVTCEHYLKVTRTSSL